ncbi:MAG: Fic family protein [Acholeplasmataceae bacterium]|jgi:Fic family protein|nr:Fic family protein [Acholeplasmataceae bacterium]
MEKDLLEVERKHLENVVKEREIEQLEEIEKKFALLYTYDAVGMVGQNRIPYEDVKRCSQAKALLEYSEREQKEILNHLKAFEFVMQEAKAKKPFNEEKMKDIHEILVEGIFQGGVYRNVNINIFGATHQPPDYIKVYDRMAKFFNNLENFEGSPLEIATYAHASIAKIHPFVDANGRLAKLVLNYFLIKHNYLPISIPLEQREAYIEDLEAFKTEKDLKPLMTLFKDLLIKRYEEVIKELDV